eukprot:UN24559
MICFLKCASLNYNDEHERGKKMKFFCNISRKQKHPRQFKLGIRKKKHCHFCLTNQHNLCCCCFAIVQVMIICFSVRAYEKVSVLWKILKLLYTWRARCKLFF